MLTKTMGGISRLRALTATGVIFACTCAVLVFGGAAPAQPSSALRTVRYHGVSIRVPRSWPVFDLARNRQACVRFDRHAVYLGTPGREERCPAHAVGRTEAILLSPLRTSRGLPSATADGLQLEGDATSFSLRSAGVQVTATWARAPRVVAQALGRRSLPGAEQGPANGAGSAAAGGSTQSSGGRGGSSIPGSVYTGLGFDTCSAPSARQMSAWRRSSPFRAIGIYIGGVNSACAQPNLTKRWINHEIASGWHPVPLWVGLQAPVNECGCRGISTNTARAHSQGEIAASDAVARAKRLGILPGNPIYNDMEGHLTGGSNTAPVLSYFSGWTTRLHANGYISGIYGSASSTINDLVSKYRTRYREPDDIWIADWNGQRTAHDPYVPGAEWSKHQRLHQFRGNQHQRYGGVTLAVDDDFLNGATANARNGYMLLTSNGGIHLFGPIAGYGSAGGKLPRGVTAVALARDRRTGGYWILRSDGGVANFHAPWHGGLRHNLGGTRPVALAGSPTGGYLVLTSNGGVHGFGPIGRYGGDAGKLSPGVTAVALARDFKTGGYWILRSDGSVGNFHAPWHGGLRNKLGGTRPVAVAAAQRGGYFILTSNGAVHPFGPAKLHGSDAGKLPAGVTAVSIATSPSTTGYRILRSKGGVDCFGAICYGSLFGRLPGHSRPLTIADATG